MRLSRLALSFSTALRVTSVGSFTLSAGFRLASEDQQDAIGVVGCGLELGRTLLAALVVANLQGVAFDRVDALDFVLPLEPPRLISLGFVSDLIDQ